MIIVPHFTDPYKRGITVETTRHLRRLGRDIPAGTRGQVTGSGTYYGTAEVRIATDHGSFVVAPGEIRQVIGAEAHVDGTV
jgi:hypothetical protein